MDSSEAVSSLRSRVENEMLSCGINLDGNDGLVVRRMLHEPCMALREGRKVNEDEALQQIYLELGIESHK